MQSLKQRIIEARTELGIDPAEMARRVGVQPAAAYQWESGATKSLKASTAVALANVLGVHVEWLTSGRLPKKGEGRAVEPISNRDETHSQALPNQHRRVRIEGTAAMDDKGYWRQGDEEAETFDVITEDPGAYAVRLITQRFQPVADLGACILVSPGRELREGRHALVTLGDGRRTLRTFRGRSYGVWRFTDVNNGNSYLDLPESEVERVDRVMSVFWTD